MSDYPLLGRALPSRNVRGLSEFPTEEKGLHLGPAEPASVLLRREYGTWAHVIPYWPANLGESTYTGDEYPRINKSALADLRAAGTDLLTQWLVFDWDNPRHKPHTELGGRERVHAILRAFDQLGTIDPDLRPHIAYATRNGWRTLHALAAPLPVDRAESLHRSWVPRLIEALDALCAQKKCPLPAPILDPGCSDWTRLFGCPRVLRDPAEPPVENLRTWFEEHWIDPAEHPPIELPRSLPLDPRAADSVLRSALLGTDALPRPRPADRPEGVGGESKTEAQQSVASPLTPAAPAPLTQRDVPVWAEPPDDNECDQLLDALGTTPEGRHLSIRAQQRTRGRTSDPFLWKDHELAPAEGPGRSTAIHLVAGCAASWLYHCPGFTPELLYALLWQQVALWHPTSIPHPHTHNERGWLLHLWDAIGKYWLRERQRVERNPEAFAITSGGTKAATPTPAGASLSAGAPASGPTQARLEPTPLARQHSLLGGICAGIATWPRPPLEVVGPHADTQSAQLWVLRHLIAIRGQSEYYVLRPDGYYDVYPTSPASLIPTLQQLGLSELVSLMAVTGTGSERHKTPAELVRDHGVRIVSRAMRVGLWAGGTPTGAGAVPGAAITIDPAAGGSASMEFSAFARAALEPRFDAQVDEWLRRLVGAPCEGHQSEAAHALEPLYERLCSWIAWSLAWEEGPIAAIALHGAPGAGKKMFARGLAEATNPPRVATGDDLGKWQYGLADSPWLIVDEGIPDEVAKSDRADVFRRLVAGEEFSVRTKNQHPYTARCPVRMVFTSNNTDAIADLTGGRDLTSDDRKAIAERLLVVPIDESCPGWLKRIGGIEHTRGWIDGDGGQPGERRVARHFLWLHSVRHRWAPGARFLVEGSDDSNLRRELLAASPLAPFFAEATIRLIERGGAPTHVRADEEGVWVTTSGVLESMREIARKVPGTRLPSNRAVGGVLKGFCRSGCWSVQRFRKAGETDAEGRPALDGAMRWHGLDAEALCRAAEELGLGHPRLSRLRLGGEAAAQVSTRPTLQIVQGGMGGIGALLEQGKGGSSGDGDS